MNIPRNIFTLKVIAFIALSSLFLTTTTQQSSKAYASNDCPCPLAETLDFQIFLADVFGVFNPDALTCRKTKDISGRHATTRIVHSNLCEFRIDTTHSTIFSRNSCSSTTPTPPSCGFVVQQDSIGLLSIAEQVACRNEILRVARHLGIPCEFD